MPRQPYGTRALTVMCTHPPDRDLHREPICVCDVLLRSSLHGLPMSEWNSGMCDVCKRLDEKIEHYKKVISAMTDQLTIERITALVLDMQTQKASLHPVGPAGPAK